MARPGAFQNLSSREKTLLLVAFLMVVVGGSSVAYIYLDSENQALQESIDTGREAITTIQERSREYVDSMRKKEALEEAIKANDTRIQTAIDAIARKVEAITDAEGKAPAGTFDRILRYEAKTTQRPLVLGQKAAKKGSKKESATDFQEVSQPVDYGMVRFLDLVKFWEQIEAPDRLMYISKIEINRKFGADNIVHGRMTISTFIYQPQETDKEEGEESADKE